MKRFLSISLFVAVLSAAGAIAADLPAPAAPTNDACRLTRVASEKMLVAADGLPSVPLTIGGAPVNLVVDTSAVASTLNASTVHQLGLKGQELRAGVISTMGRMPFTERVEEGLKNETHWRVNAPNVVLGGWPSATLAFFALRHDLYGQPHNGVLGSDLLMNFDDEFDFADETINLFSQDHCLGQVVYWTRQPAARIPFDLDKDDNIVIAVELDGKPLRAILLTASTQTTALFENMESDFDIDRKSPGLKTMPAADGKSDVYTYPFKTLSLEGVTIQNPTIWMYPDMSQGISRGPNTLGIGLDTLQRFRVFISYKEKAIYLTSAAAH